MKRFLVLFLAAVLAFSMSGCGILEMIANGEDIDLDGFISREEDDIPVEEFVPGSQQIVVNGNQFIVPGISAVGFLPVYKGSPGGIQEVPRSGAR